MSTILALMLMLIAPHAFSQTNAPIATAPIMQSRGIVLHVHSGITDQRFLPELVRRLEATFAPPVHTLTTNLDLAPLRPMFGPIDGEQLTGVVVNAVNWVQNRDTVQVLLLADDIRLKPANYSFAVSNGTAQTAHHVVIVSLDRLQQVAITASGADRNPARTAERVFKLVAKNVARVSGYASSTLCLFGFARNVSELDATPEGFCEPDRSILIAAGLAKR